MTTIYTRVLFYTYEEEENPDYINIHDAKFDKTVTIPRDYETTPDFSVMNWLQKKNIACLGCMMNHITCEFDGPVPDLREYNVTGVHVLEVSTVKNDNGSFQLMIYSARYGQSVYIDNCAGHDTIDNAYIWLDKNGFRVESSDVESLKMYIVTSTLKPLKEPIELV